MIEEMSHRTKNPKTTPFGQATQIALSLAVARKVETVSLAPSLGRILAEDVPADGDSPPFDRSLMDGFAIIKGDASSEYQIIETIAAGEKPKKKLRIGTCAKIMTGAMLPAKAGRVIKIEDTLTSGRFMKIVADDSSHYIARRGEYFKKGAVILPGPKEIRPQEVALLANLGRIHVKVFSRPQVAVLSTGSEVIDPHQIPRGAEIRNSNSAMIAALIQKQGSVACELGIIKDERAALTRGLRQALSTHSIVVCTGGVSMGGYDFLPAVLQALSFKILFSGVAIQPGKPTLLAQKGKKIVFALPGNPVSAFVAFILFAAPFLDRLLGRDELPLFFPATMAEPFTRKNAERMLFLPGSWIDKSGVKGLSFQGSGQINVLCEANCLIQIPEGVSSLKQGDVVYARPI
jgi:molybdopterin molybdotransferase